MVSTSCSYQCPWGSGCAAGSRQSRSRKDGRCCDIENLQPLLAYWKVTMCMSMPGHECLGSTVWGTGGRATSVQPLASSGLTWIIICAWWHGPGCAHAVMICLTCVWSEPEAMQSVNMSLGTDGLLYYDEYGSRRVANTMRRGLHLFLIADGGLARINNVRQPACEQFYSNCFHNTSNPTWQSLS